MPEEIQLETDPLKAPEGIAKKKFNTKIDNENGLAQFEECDVKHCVYYNHKGHCSFETCKVRLEDPMNASMILKVCQFCGNEFATTLSGMVIQLCPACLKACLKAEGHPHKCIFCGEEIDQNPSIFFPACPECFEKLTILANGDKDCIELAANSAHCDDDGGFGGMLGSIAAIAGTVALASTGFGAAFAGMASTLSTVGTVASAVGSVAGMAGMGQLAGIAGSIGNIAGLAGGLGNIAGLAGNLGSIADIAGNFGNITGAISGLGDIAGIAGNLGNITGAISSLGDIAGLAGSLTNIGDVVGTISSLGGIGDIAGIGDALSSLGDIGNIASQFGGLTETLSGLGNLTGVISGLGDIGNVVGGLTNIGDFANQIGNLTGTIADLGNVAEIATQFQGITDISQVVTNLGDLASNEGLNRIAQSIAGVTGTIDDIDSLMRLTMHDLSANLGEINDSVSYMSDCYNEMTKTKMDILHRDGVSREETNELLRLLRRDSNGNRIIDQLVVTNV